MTHGWGTIPGQHRASATKTRRTGLTAGMAWLTRKARTAALNPVMPSGP